MSTDIRIKWNIGKFRLLPDGFFPSELRRNRLDRLVPTRSAVQLSVVHRAHLNIALSAFGPIGRLQEVNQGPPHSKLTCVSENHHENKMKTQNKTNRTANPISFDQQWGDLMLQSIKAARSMWCNANWSTDGSAEQCCTHSVGEKGNIWQFISHSLHSTPLEGFSNLLWDLSLFFSSMPKSFYWSVAQDMLRRSF